MYFYPCDVTRTAPLHLVLPCVCACPQVQLTAHLSASSSILSTGPKSVPVMSLTQHLSPLHHAHWPYHVHQVITECVHLALWHCSHVHSLQPRTIRLIKYWPYHDNNEKRKNKIKIQIYLIIPRTPAPSPTITSVSKFNFFTVTIHQILSYSGNVFFLEHMNCNILKLLNKI